MIPIQLKLSCLKHCYIRLPLLLKQKEKSLKSGSLVSIKSVQTDSELVIIWDGQTSSGDYVELDFTFAKANNFTDELIIIWLDNQVYIEPKKCQHCCVEMLNNEDYNIVSQHNETYLLQSCKLINVGLVIPIWFSQNVSILVKVVDIQPYQQYAYLTEQTEMSFKYSNDDKTLIKKSIQNEKLSSDNIDANIVDPIPFISCSLGVNYKLKFHLGSMLICGERGSGKTYMLKRILDISYRQFNSKLYNCKQLRGKRSDNIEKIFNEMLYEAFEKQPYILGLDDIDSFLAFNSKLEDEKGQEAIYNKKLVDIFCQKLKLLERNNDQARGRNVLIIATCQSLDALDPKLSKSKGRNYFNEIIQIKNPSLFDRVNILKNVIYKYKQIKCNINENQFESFCKSLDNYMPMDLVRIVERAIINSCSRTLLEFNSEPLEIIEQDLLSSIKDYLPFNLRNVSLRPKTLRNFHDVGGMKVIKETLLKTILLQIKYPTLFKNCPLKTQSSILLYGPPGCGKTLLAEALTNEESLNSICVRGPELLSKYIGASEAAVRDLFVRAQLARPCVIFFDEFESLVSKRGTDSTGVTDRIVNQFLTLMDGVEKLSNDVFIIAATSRPDMIDPAILRPGRLDKHIYCPIPNQEDRYEILKVLTRNINFDKKSPVDLLEWSKKLDCFTGADIQSFMYSAQLKALHELIGPTDFSGSNTGDINKQKNKDVDIIVKQAHMMESFNDMEQDTLRRYKVLLQKYPKSFRKLGQQTIATRATLA